MAKGKNKSVTLPPLSDEDIEIYVGFLHNAFVSNYVAHQYAGMAQSILRKTGHLFLEEKKLLHQSLIHLAELENLSHKAIKTKRKKFFADIAFIDNLMDGINENVKSTEDEEKIISFINSLHE